MEGPTPIPLDRTNLLLLEIERKESPPKSETKSLITAVLGELVALYSTLQVFIQIRGSFFTFVQVMPKLFREFLETRMSRLAWRLMDS